MLYAGLGRFKEAVDIFERVIQEMPHVAFSHYGKGDALYGLGRFDEALAAYEHAIALNYSDAVTIYIQRENPLSTRST